MNASVGLVDAEPWLSISASDTAHPKPWTIAVDDHLDIDRLGNEIMEMAGNLGDEPIQERLLQCGSARVTVSVNVVERNGKLRLTDGDGQLLEISSEQPEALIASFGQMLKDLSTTPLTERSLS